MLTEGEVTEDTLVNGTYSARKQSNLVKSVVLVRINSAMLMAEKSSLVWKYYVLVYETRDVRFVRSKNRIAY